MKRIQAVIFDMDGVLVDAKAWHCEALNRALAQFGQTIGLEEHLTTFDGLPTRTKLEILSRERGFPRELHDEVNQLKQQFTLDIIHESCRPVPRIQHALALLKSQGYIVGVASNSIRATVDAMMLRSGLDPYLDFRLSNQDVARPKPAPDIYLKAISWAGVSPEECVVVEDNHYGIEAAQAAGAHVLQVQGVSEVVFRRIQAFIQHCDEKLEGLPWRQVAPTLRAA